VTGPATFVGLGNFVTLANDPIFWQSVGNTVKFTGAATVLKAIGGLGMALVMNQNFKFKAITRALLLLPFIVPTVLSTVAWQWIYDPGLGLFNRLLVESGLAKTGPSWLGSPTMAMISVILTFFDFQLVYVLTGGGPANSTHLMATYAYSLSMGAGQMGLGSAVALSMVPVLGLLLVLLTYYVRKD
jgi:multiple sugar transport system permease protein